MEIKSKYACSQSALYQICLLIALNCKSKIADFGLDVNEGSFVVKVGGLEG
jgi:hypothetical protein